MPLNGTSKVLKMVSFTVCEFYPDENKKVNEKEMG